MDIFEGQNILNFVEEYPTDDSCKAYLAKLKWEKSFTCRKCNHDKGCLKLGYKYECYSCSHVESSTANTLFHKVKFGLRKAFCIVFEMSTSSRSLASTQVAVRYGISQPTAWYFMQKVRIATKSSQQHKLIDLVHVDEFCIGGKETGKQGRSYDSKKKKAVIAVELTPKHQVKRMYIKGINDYSAKSLTPIFEQHIDPTAKVITDKWRGYEPLKKDYNIQQIPSDNGNNFKKLHIMIHQVKTWIRTIPTHVSISHIQAYFDEFCFRINHSQSKNTIFHNLINRMVNHKHVLQKEIISN